MPASLGDALPWIVAVGLMSTFVPLFLAFRAARETALRPAIVWAAMAVVLGTIAALQTTREPFSSGRPLAGQWAYLASLATLAALVTIFNARRPGNAAWALLMGLLVLVLLLPWLEGSGLAGRSSEWDRLALESPWSLFYGLLIFATVANYLPTRYGLAALILGLGLIGMFLALTRTGASYASRGIAWIGMPAGLALALWVAAWKAISFRQRSSRLETLWLWFRDHWGVVWGLRILDRFNRAAAIQGWPFRLSWQGVTSLNEAEEMASPDAQEAALATLKGLLRRFATDEAFDQLLASRSSLSTRES